MSQLKKFLTSTEANTKIISYELARVLKWKKNSKMKNFPKHAL